jgi:putative transposase
MHLTLKKETTKPAGLKFLQQQARFDDFIEIFNNERPHEALDMKCPAEVYQPSVRAYKGLPDIDYPFHDKSLLRPHLSGAQKDQLQHGLCRPGGRHQRSSR